MSRKTAIVRLNHATAYCDFVNDIPDKADIYYDDEENIIGNIYVGYVKDIVKNIKCCFVEYEPGKKAYLQMDGNARPFYLNVKNSNTISSGDRIIIQIKKDPIKTKDAVCSTAFELAGKYAVLTFKGTDHMENGYLPAFSAKISDEKFKEEVSFAIKNTVYEKIEKECSLLIRTAAYDADIHCVLEEIDKLVSEYEELIRTAKIRPKNFLLKKAETPLFSSIKELEYKDGDRLITDDKEIYDNLLRLYNSNELKGNVCPEFYEDKLLPLYKLYSFEKIFSEISSKKVWLKSGAYLVIEHTEALTVIDVNTGKCNKGKNKEETFFKINQEAAEVISRQLRLRNVSGIIIIDFIDMAELTMRNKLGEVMKRLVADDKIKTTVVDFTKLNLMELTRKKTRDLLKVRNDLFEKL